jgi:hypothetical protein
MLIELRLRMRWRWVLLSTGSLVAVSTALLLFYKPFIVSCDELQPSGESELIKRADEILQNIGQDPTTLAKYSTSQFRQTLSPDTNKALAESFAPLLKRQHRYLEVWRASNFSSIWQPAGTTLTAICKATTPHADTMAIPADAGHAAAVHVEFIGLPMSYRLVVQLVRSSGDWRVSALSIQPYRHNGKDADYFGRLGDERKAQGHQADAVVAYLAAERLSRRMQGIQTSEHTQIMEKLAPLSSREVIARLIPRERVQRDDDFLGLSMEATTDAGLLPLVSFVNADSSADGNLLARSFALGLVKEVPILLEDFGFLATKAYPEAPVSGRPYDTFGAVISTDQLHVVAK